MVFPEEVVVNAMYLKYNRFLGNHIFANDFYAKPDISGVFLILSG